MSKVHVLQEDEVSNFSSGSDADVESDELSDDIENKISENTENDDTGINGNENTKSGMADAMARILGKQLPKKKGVILAKGMTDKQIERKRKLKEGGTEEGKTKIHVDQLTRQAMKKKWENRERVKPDPLEKPAERILQRIATRGIVQLFNAVSQQQKLLDDQLVEAGSSERRQEKVVESMTKDKFLDILKGTSSKSPDKSFSAQNKKKKRDKIQSNNTAKDEAVSSKWSILRDDFMMGATMKDWDKESSDGEELPDD